MKTSEPVIVSFSIIILADNELMNETANRFQKKIGATT